MRKILILGALAALAVPATAAADPNPNSPAQQCRAERTAMGVTNFNNTHGTNARKTNAFGKCVSKQRRNANSNRANAARACRAERSDPNFAAGHGGQTFAEFYGTNRGNRNAFGKCVSSKASAKTAAQQQARLRASRTCRTSQRTDAAAFRRAFGGRRNAFGKCVSREARRQS